MNVKVLVPHWRITGGVGSRRITSVTPLGSDVFVGLSNGDLVIYATPEPQGRVVTLDSEPVRVHQNLTRDHTPIKAILEIVPRPFGADSTASRVQSASSAKNIGSKTVIVVLGSNGVYIYEMVGAHINLMHSIAGVGTVVAYDNENHVLATTRPKVGVEWFSVGHKSRNVLLVTSMGVCKQVEPVYAMRWLAAGELMVAFGESLAIITKNESLQLSTISCPRLPLPSQSYFRKQNPMVWISPWQVQAPVVYVVRGNHILEVGMDRQVKYRARLASVPLDCAFLAGVLVAVTSAKIEVICLETGSPLQSIPHSVASSKIIISEGVVAGSHDLIGYHQLDRHRVVEQLVKQGTLEAINNAIAYYEATPAGGDVVENLDGLRRLYWQKVRLLFVDRHKYREAMELCGEWLLPYCQVISLFPRFLADTDASTLQETFARRSPTPLPFDGVNPHDIDLVASRPASPQESAGPKSIRSVRSMRSLRSADPKSSPLAEATEGLSRYLTEHRRVLANFNSSSTINWKGHEFSFDDIFGISSRHGHGATPTMGQLGTSVDTSLFLCYYYTRPILLGPFLRLANNRARFKVVSSHLNPDTHLGDLLDFFFTRGQHREVLEQLHLLSHPTDHQEPLSPSMTIHYLQRLDKSQLEVVFQFGFWVIQEANDEEDELGQSEKQAAVRELFMNSTSQCESYDPFKVVDYLLTVVKYDDAAIDYLEWSLDEDDHFLPPKTRRKLSTQLALLFITKLKQARQGMDLKNFECNRYYLKFYRFLDHHHEFEPLKVLRALPEDEWFKRFAVFIHRQLGDHQRALDILYLELNDLEATMEYIDKLPAGETTKELLHTLLDHMIANDDETVDNVDRFLSREGPHMEVLRILISLPQNFPLAQLTSFLEQVLRQSQQSVNHTAIGANLYQLGSNNVDDNLAEERAKGYVVGSQATPCAVCGRKLGVSVAAIRDDNVVHYGCSK